MGKIHLPFSLLKECASVIESYSRAWMWLGINISLCNRSEALKKHTRAATRWDGKGKQQKGETLGLNLCALRLLFRKQLVIPNQINCSGKKEQKDKDSLRSRLKWNGLANSRRPNIYHSNDYKAWHQLLKPTCLEVLGIKKNGCNVVCDAYHTATMTRALWKQFALRMSQHGNHNQLRMWLFKVSQQVCDWNRSVILSGTDGAQGLWEWLLIHVLMFFLIKFN